jgi:hypothetical protein
MLVIVTASCRLIVTPDLIRGLPSLLQSINRRRVPDQVRQ